MICPTCESLQNKPTLSAVQLFSLTVDHILYCHRPGCDTFQYLDFSLSCLFSWGTASVCRVRYEKECKNLYVGCFRFFSCLVDEKSCFFFTFLLQVLAFVYSNNLGGVVPQIVRDRAGFIAEWFD